MTRSRLIPQEHVRRTELGQQAVPSNNAQSPVQSLRNYPKKRKLQMIFGALANRSRSFLRRYLMNEPRTENSQSLISSGKRQVSIISFSKQLKPNIHKHLAGLDVPCLFWHRKQQMSSDEMWLLALPKCLRQPLKYWTYQIRLSSNRPQGYSI